MSTGRARTASTAATGDAGARVAHARPASAGAGQRPGGRGPSVDDDDHLLRARAGRRRPPPPRATSASALDPLLEPDRGDRAVRGA